MIKATYIDHMGTDLTVVNAARVSFNKQHDVYKEQEDNRLIHYLSKHEHMSPFGHCFASFHVKAPVFVARQLVKHKFLRWNEISRRYVDSNPEFYLPDVWRGRSEDKKQGSTGVWYDDDLDSLLESCHKVCLHDYKELLDNGVCPEQARMVLPQSMMTEWYWSGSLDAFADMCNLRLAPDTQEETRQVAQQISVKMSNLFPVSWSALVKRQSVNKEIRPMTDEERNRATEREELNQAWYDGDGAELFL
jgi:thymidylate synthase (FAD)